MLQPLLVQPDDRREPLDPPLAPLPQLHLAGGALDEVAPLVDPAPAQDHLAAELARHLDVSGVAVADQEHRALDRTEQLHRGLGAARGVDVVIDGILADRYPQPRAPRTAGLAQRLDAPAGLVAVAHRHPVLMGEDRLGERREQRQEAPHAARQRPRRDRQPLVGHPRRDLTQGPEAGKALVEDARPDAGPVGRPGEQPRRRGRDRLRGRGWAVAAPAVARTHDPADMGLDRDLDDRRGTLAVGDIGLAAAGTYERVRRRLLPFLLLLERRPRGAAVTGRAVLLAAFALRARRLPLLAPAPEDRLRQHRPGRTELHNPGFQSRAPGAQGLHLLAQPLVRPALPSDLLAQRPDGPVPRAHRPEDSGEQGTFGKLGLQPLLLPGGRQQGHSQMPDPPFQRPGAVRPDPEAGHRLAESVDLVVQPQEPVPEIRQRCQLAAQPVIIPVPPTDLPVQPVSPLPRPFQRLAQPGVQPRRIAGLLRLLNRLVKLVPALLEARRQRNRPATRIPFRPEQGLAARLRRIRAGFCPFEQGPPVARLPRGRRPKSAIRPARRRHRRKILWHRHARDDSESPAPLPVSRRASRYDRRPPPIAA